MKQFERVKNMSIDERAKFIGVYSFEQEEYLKWFNRTICDKCLPKKLNLWERKITCMNVTFREIAHITKNCLTWRSCILKVR